MQTEFQKSLIQKIRKIRKEELFPSSSRSFLDRSEQRVPVQNYAVSLTFGSVTGVHRQKSRAHFDSIRFWVKNSGVPKSVPMRRSRRKAEFPIHLIFTVARGLEAYVHGLLFDLMDYWTVSPRAGFPRINAEHDFFGNPAALFATVQLAFIAFDSCHFTRRNLRNCQCSLSSIS